MSNENTQEVLFQDPIGLRLRQGREKAGLSIEQVGQQLKLPIAIIEAMERDDWPRLGAPVYVRSYLGSYLRLVGLPAALAENVAQNGATPKLVPLGTGSRMRHALKHSVRNMVYLVMTAVLVIPVVLVARHYQSAGSTQVLTLEPEVVSTPVPAPALASDPSLAPPMVSEPAAEAPPQTQAADPAPVMASMAPFQKTAPTSTELLLRFSGESWIETVDASGARIERGLVAGGSERRYAPGQVARITLGNADAVEVSFAGETVDLAPYRAANVARFAVSSGGEPAPAEH
ncbi:RodZ domain-containing protein [Arenimonas daejeonensis]|uniref:RodZ domain-containing protein n=1 Tax=Arenimonas daejeonensis TaxID=370777 RepID=UPI0011BE11FA|nr:helix-turn-helix domain-containing protein [Arenimonas daejeonensis]